MKLASLKLTSSQRWAIAAVGLAVLFACSPRGPDPAPEPAQPTPQPPSLSSVSTPAVETAEPAVDAQAPGFAGEWAFADADCAEPAKTFKLGADKIVMSPGERSCEVRSLSKSIRRGGRRSTPSPQAAWRRASRARTGSRSISAPRTR